MQTNFDIPFKNIVEFGQQTMLDNKLFSVSWILSRFCNYNCSYCWPYAHSNKADHRPLEQYKQTIDEIKRQARDNGFTDFHFSFSGGEPTAYKHFNDLVRWLYNEGPNPYSCAFMGELVSIFMTVLVSHFSKNLPEEHLRVLFLKKKDPNRV